MNLVLLFFPFSLVALTMIGFIVHIPVTAIHFLVALVLTVGVIWKTSVTPCRDLRFFVSLLFAAILCAALPVMYTVTDGATCHRPATFLLAQGWNPVCQSEHADLLALLTQFFPQSFVTHHTHMAYMPRGAWIVGAVLYKVCGFIEVGDALNFYMLFTAFILFKNWFERFMGFGRVMTRLLATFLCVAPVVAGGLLGGCCDASVYLLTICGLLSLDAFVREEKREDLLIAVMALSLAASIKFTGLSLAIVSPWVYLFFAHKRKAVLGGAIGALGCVALLNFSPFVTNAINHGGPFYPAHSFSKAEKLPDAMTGDFDMKNADAEKMGAFGRFAYAYLSRDITAVYYKVMLKQKVFDPQLMLFHEIDGLGRIYSVLFVLSIVALFVIKDRGLKVMIVLLAVSIFLQPSKYMGYARYVSQIYAIPILAGVGIMKRFGTRPVSWCVMAMFVFYVLSFMPKAVLCYPYMWLMSVQNLQIAQQVEREDHPQVATRFFYCAQAMKYDTNGMTEVVPLKVAEDWTAASVYGPCTGKYYFRATSPIKDFRSFACAPITDYGTVMDKSFSSKRRAGIEKYFIHEFLPREIWMLPKRFMQVLAYRGRQFVRAWAR